MRGEDILNSCELGEDGPYVLAFLVEPSEECADQIDLLDELRPRFKDVQFAAVAIRGDHEELNDLIRARGWELPVAYDHDGAIANAFAVAVCPTITFADTGGIVSADHAGHRLRGRDRAGDQGAEVNEPVECLVEAEVGEELPGLRLWSLTIDAGEGYSPPELKHRMSVLSSRFYGSHALALRSKPIPHAYRVFFRHIGLDPDVHRVPVEAVVVERLKAGGFTSRSRVHDALTIAIMETSVPVWALDEDTLTGELELRRAEEHEPLGRADPHALWLPSGRLVVADLGGPVAILFGDVAKNHTAVSGTRRIRLFAVQVEGVPNISVSEALWSAADIITESAR